MKMKKKKWFFFFSKFSAAHFQLKLRNNICSTEEQQDEVKLGVQSSSSLNTKLGFADSLASLVADEHVHTYPARLAK